MCESSRPSVFCVVKFKMSRNSICFAYFVLLLCLTLRLELARAEVGFSLHGATYQNNSIVMLENIGEGGGSLLCITDLRNCCRPSDQVLHALGNWFFPNLTRVPSSGNNWDYHRTRGQSVVSLSRRRGGEEGIYHCEIPDAASVFQTLYIGVYSKDTGAPNVTELTLDRESRTLTCTSTGGPATTVTWTKDGAVITPSTTHQQTQMIVDTVGGIYKNTLTIAQSVTGENLYGLYSCTVENSRGSSNRTTFYNAGDVRFSFRGTTYHNNSIVKLEHIGEGGNSLLCVTDLRNCCGLSQVRTLGNWFFPNLTRVPSSGNHWDYHRTRGQSVVRLSRRRGGEEGIYRCEIPDAASVVQTLYIGVYSKDTGAPNITELTLDRESRTVTCTSTGGPATTVTWTKDGAVITPSTTHQQTQMIVDAVGGIYQNTLTIAQSVTGDNLYGLYSCTVENSRGSSNRTIHLYARPEQPRNVTSVNTTSHSITLVWEEPHNNNTPITGYRVTYQQPAFNDASNGVQVVNSTVEMADITGLHPGITYNFTVVAFNKIGDSAPSDIVSVSTQQLDSTDPPPVLTIIIAGVAAGVSIIAILVTAVVIVAVVRRRTSYKLKDLNKRNDTSMLENEPAVEMNMKVCEAYADSIEHMESVYAYACATPGDTVQHQQAIAISDLNDDHTYDSPAFKETFWHQKAVTMNEYDCPADGNSVQHPQVLTVSDDHMYESPAYKETLQHQQAVTVTEYNCPAYGNSVQHHPALTVNNDRTYDCPAYGNSVQHHPALTVNNDCTYDCPAYENSGQHQHAVSMDGLDGDHTYDNPADKETKFSLLIHRTDNPMYIPTAEDCKDSISEDHIYERIVIKPGDHFNSYQNEDH